MTAPAPYASWTVDGLRVILRGHEHDLAHLDAADEEFGANGQAFRSVRRADVRRKIAAVIAAMAQRTDPVCVSVEDTYVCAACERVVANVEDHASRCPVPGIDAAITTRTP